jgi:IclR family transcriptional regulator, acetate operon repressor
VSATKPYPGTKSVLRAITLLKAFSDEHSEWLLADLARQVGLNKTTTFRLLTALESEGLVARSERSGAYRLGVAMVTLAGQVLRANELRAVCRPELETLAAGTQETVSMEVLFDNEVVILDEVTGKHVMSGVQSIGTRWPAHATSTGKILLAGLPPESVRDHLPETLAAFTPSTITTAEALLQELAVSRERGYATAREELEPGLVAVAAPVKNHDGDTAAAISLAGPTVRLTAELVPEFGRLVVEAARRASLRLGYSP